MGRVSASVIFTAAFAVIVLVAGVTVVAVDALDLDDDSAATTTATSGPTVPEVVPAEGQVVVTGDATAFVVEGVRFEPLPTTSPLVVTTPDRGFGAGATITGVTIDGRESSIEWDAGRPFDLRGAGGAIVPAFVNLSVDGPNVTVGLPDGIAHSFTAGTYTLHTPVAVAGRGGLAEPSDRVTFTATDESRITFRGGASTGLAARHFELEGPGRVVLEGDFEVRRPSGTELPASRVELDPAPFVLSATPTGGSYRIDATLQGTVTTS